MTLEINISEGVARLVFWLPFGLMTFICYRLIKRNIRKLSKPELSTAERSFTKFRIALMILPLLAFSLGFLYFTIKIVLLILGI